MITMGWVYRCFCEHTWEARQLGNIGHVSGWLDPHDRRITVPTLGHWRPAWSPLALIRGKVVDSPRGRARGAQPSTLFEVMPVVSRKSAVRAARRKIERECKRYTRLHASLRLPVQLTLFDN